ncbi:MAG TPA: thioredoxin domain-containing protein [Flavisolibacter sp.]|nr:thioredoxin domain-containing protein [Flavisolibacter sp.]
MFSTIYNKEILQALLQKQKRITAPAEDLGITLGNPAAKHIIIKVCNPYCGPCAKAHSIIDKILEENEDVKVQIIFTATNDEKDIKAVPVKHLMALYEKNNPELIKQALDDWYNANTKDYDAFALKYSLNGELKLQGEKLELMDKWCKGTGISVTPTMFIDVTNYRKCIKLKT